MNYRDRTRWLACCVALSGTLPGWAHAAPPDAKANVIVLAQASGDAAQRKFLRDGMTEGEVLLAVGRPDHIDHTNLYWSGRNQHATVWSYFPAAGDAQTLTSVYFLGGKVIKIQRDIKR